MTRKHPRTADRPIDTGGPAGPERHALTADLPAIALRPHVAGQRGDAARDDRRALHIDPEHLDALNYFGQRLLGVGNVEGALAAFTRALSIRETEPTKAMFVGCLQRLRDVPDVPGLRGLVVRAMSEPWARPADLAYAAVSLIKRGGAVGECITRAGAAWPQRLSERRLFGTAGPAEIAEDTLLRVTLESTPVCDVDLERFLTTFRSTMLGAAALGGGAAALSGAVLAIYAALARQCFINEYVFALADGEAAEAGRLRESVQRALNTDAPIAPFAVVALGAYCPLHSLSAAERLLERPWPQPVTALLSQQVREPLEESRLRAAIPRLTPVNDSVSRQVQQQYEEHPYPRWVRVRARRATVSIAAYLRGHFPMASCPTLEHTNSIDYLMAGCGTGQTTIEIARLIRGVKVLAVDLSAASLAYAKRKAAECGVSNIDFAQADILELSSLGRRFHVINCSGVLHHLADPMAGWRILVSLLRPGGVMRLGLYSAIARTQSTAARAFAAERGFRPTAADIRRCRQEIVDLPDTHPIKREARNADFFSMSGCRDWLFHVRERPLTLPEVGRFLGEHGLDFIGFHLAPAVAARYAARFPQDRTLTDFGCWHQFEQEHPRSFVGMYQFWVQARLAGS